MISDHTPLAPLLVRAWQVLEELLQQRAGKAVVKDVLQSAAPSSAPVQPLQVAIPLKGGTRAPDDSDDHPCLQRVTSRHGRAGMSCGAT